MNEVNEGHTFRPLLTLFGHLWLVFFWAVFGHIWPLLDASGLFVDGIGQNLVKLTKILTNVQNG